METPLTGVAFGDLHNKGIHTLFDIVGQIAEMAYLVQSGIPKGL